MSAETIERTASGDTRQPLPPPHIWLWRRVTRYGPGLLALGAVGYLALLISSYLTGLQYVPTAVLLGAFVSNAFGLHPALQKGVSTYELWLKAGIVLLGTQVAFGALGAFWLRAVPLAALTVVVGIVVMLWLGRLLRLPPRLTLLLAAGTSVCGVSAIMHTAPEVGAEDEEVEYAVGAVLGLGAAAMLLYPLVGGLLDLGPEAYGLWAGLSVNNTAEAVAAGYSYAAAAGSIAVAAKLCRVAMIGGAVAYLGSRAPDRQGAGARSAGPRLWSRLPKFVLVFLGFSLLAETGLISGEERESLRNASSWLFLVAFAGIGFKLRWRDVRRAGLRPLLAAGLVSLILGALTLLGAVLLGEARL